ncbi:NAD(P)-dependent alcohol dehydrogenase [Glycomyces algeriensis]|uniref:NADPH:quinone reductase n=1 Tax=Glycomyces algeriensis TaxID=256037 RepID=A0A9W6GD65_9ACTN|nr:NAD(P)-dependent alcohol dehydrogenase [Glycomyces algeriensis]MDA1367831.1 NAD(P)-dependent alcohol dehydrogenase [Glycomyces algeriensis]MDR7351977.1 NADPH:quinone reductase-like Zn-dependent oxidoreductase [Glycomyces algeriensis]GLI44710.1 NADPH:quinone reductase [Glycomyces algeriensis]
MRAIVQDRYGPPGEVLALKEIDRPAPGPGEVLVRVRASSVNTPDWIAITGVPYVLRFQGRVRSGSNVVRGTDVAGVVEELGPEGADRGIGDRVFGSLWTSTFVTAGAFAEFAVVPAERLAPIPAGVGFEEAAASVMSGVTALCAMRDTVQVHEGMKVLVNGASGGVGTFAVQLAAHFGAEVTGVCGTANAAMVRDLGAHHVIDYTRTDFTKGSERYDVVLDNVLNHPPRRTARVLAPGGVLIPNSVGNSGGLLAGLGRMASARMLGSLGRADVRFSPSEANRENLTAVSELLASGVIKAVIDRVYPLQETAQAVAHMLGHHARGNIVISVAKGPRTP